MERTVVRETRRACLALHTYLLCGLDKPLTSLSSTSSLVKQASSSLSTMREDVCNVVFSARWLVDCYYCGSEL